MSFQYEMMSSEMITKLMGPEIAKLGNIKKYILETYISMEGLKSKANQPGNWQAKADLSMAYREGIPKLNVEKDLDSATGWLESSIQNGNTRSLDILELGTMYDTKGTPRYQRKAYEMYLKAARLGCPQAELNLAEFYRCGLEGFLKKDLEEAFKWYRSAASEEIVPLDEPISQETYELRGFLRRISIDVKIKALTLLHKYYKNGDCPEDRPQTQKALYYLKKAALLGDIPSQKELGMTYLTGVSEVPKDLEEAKRWLEKAANNGNIEAKQVLEKFGQESAIEGVMFPDPEADKHKLESSINQHFDILKRKVAQKKHPFVIENPLMFQESMFTQYPNSPTAQHYLKAFRLAKEGLDKLQDGFFKEAMKLMALSFLYENTVLTSSFIVVKTYEFVEHVTAMIYKELKVNENFFEGLLVLVAIYSIPIEASNINLLSFKLDLKKTMFLENFIFLIENCEPSDSLPKQDPYNFEEDYSSWLHVLYYYLGAHYIIGKQFDDGAHAFDKALQCCPTYYEAKVAFAYCLVNIVVTKKTDDEQKEMKTVSSHPEEPQDRNNIQFINQRIPEDSFLRLTQEKLKQKAEQLYLEYLQEAPVCDKKYPDCCYHLATLHILNGNIQNAREWKNKGEDAEEKRLPFLGPVSAADKELFNCLDMIPKKYFKQCSNKGCPSSNQLKECPCKEAFYCGRECQKKDWKKHKKTCSERVKANNKKNG